MSTRVCKKGWYVYVIEQFIQYNMKCRPMCAFPWGTQPYFLPSGKHINIGQLNDFVYNWCKEFLRYQIDVYLKEQFF